MLGVDPHWSVYIGDSPSDGQAARNAGLRSIGVLWGANDAAALEDHFDFLAKDAEELEQWLGGTLYGSE